MTKLIPALCALLLLGMHPAAARAGTAAFSPEHDEAAFLRVYLHSLMVIDPDAPLYYDLGSAGRREALLSEIHHLASLPEAERLAPEDNERLARAERVLVPQLWRYLTAAGARDDKEGFRLYYEERKDEFAVRDWFRGARILVESGEGAGADAEELARRLDEPEADFLEVARAHYHSVGEDYDGMIGLVQRGQIHDSLFELFMEQDPAEPYFGPVPVEHGQLLGKVFAKGAEGYLPPEEVRDELIEDFVAWQVDVAGADAVSDAEARGLVERVDTADRTSPPEDSTAAYRFDGEERTYADVRRALPGVIGDTSSWEYFDAMRERAILEEVIRHGPAAERIRESSAYGILLAALGAYAAAAEPMRKELEAMQAGITGDVLRAYYDERKDEHYRPVDEIRLVHVRVSRNPDGLTGPLERREASREAWEKIQRIEREFATSEDPLAYDFGPWREQRGVRIRDASRWVSISSLEPRIAEMLWDDRTTRFSGFLINRLEYAFWYQIDRRRPLYPPFERIEDRVRRDFIEEQTRAIRAEHLGLAD